MADRPTTWREGVAIVAMNAAVMAVILFGGWLASGLVIRTLLRFGYPIPGAE